MDSEQRAIRKKMMSVRRALPTLRATLDWRVNLNEGEFVSPLTTTIVNSLYDGGTAGNLKLDYLCLKIDLYISGIHTNN